MASSILDPTPQLSDIRNDLFSELQKSFTSMAGELKELDNELKSTKGLVQKTFLLAIDARYKQGIERVEAAYKTFLDGAHNLLDTMENISAFIFELETEANNCFKLEHIKSYLQLSSQFQGLDMSRDIFGYIVFVRAKYLQIITAFYMYKNDEARIEAEFVAFNNFFLWIKGIYHEQFGKILLFEKEVADTDQEERSTLLLEGKLGISKIKDSYLGFTYSLAHICETNH